MTRTVKISVVIVALLIINLIAHLFDVQFDMTSDKKYSLDQETAIFLQSLSEPIEITVFLEGNIPIQFKKYRSYIDQLLQNMRSAGQEISLTYIDPSAGSPEERLDLQGYFRSYGVQAISRRVSTKDELSQSVLYPYISVSDQKRTIFIDLLGDKKPGQSEQQAISQSEIGLEQKIIRAIRDLSIGANGLVAVLGDQKERIATGLNNAHGQLGNYFFIPMSPDIAISNMDSIQAMMVTSHLESIDRTIQLTLDQGIMRNIPVIWFIDKYDITIDSIGTYGQYPASPRQLKVEDQLFKYGCRTEPYLLQDLRCSAIPQVIGIEGGQAQTIMIDYPYHPIVLPNNAAFTLSQEEVAIYFATTVSSIDGKPGLMSYPILSSSVQSKYTQDLSMLNFDMLRVEPDPSSYVGPQRDIGILIQGNQESYFNNRLTQSDKQFLQTRNVEFLTKTEQSKQIVIGDMQIVLAHIASDGSLYPIGYNRWEGKSYDGTLSFLSESLELLIHGDEYLGKNKHLNSARIIDRLIFDRHKYLFYFYMIGFPIIVMCSIMFLWNRYRKKLYV